LRQEEAINNWDPKIKWVKKTIRIRSCLRHRVQGVRRKRGKEQGLKRVRRERRLLIIKIKE
jgi:hypothetical protein